MEVGIAIAFWILASLAVISSAAVVLLRDIFRASLFLILSFLAVAGIYIILQADFLAVAQVLIYVGAISVLLIFAIMLTRDTQQGNPSNRLSAPGAFLAGVIFSAIIVAIFTTDWPLSSETPPESTTELSSRRPVQPLRPPLRGRFRFAIGRHDRCDSHRATERGRRQ